MTQEIRWQYRFRNFSRAYSLLRDALDSEIDALSDLEKEGVIQRFEYTFELSWNTLKDRRGVFARYSRPDRGQAIRLVCHRTGHAALGHRSGYGGHYQPAQDQASIVGGAAAELYGFDLAKVAALIE